MKKTLAILGFVAFSSAVNINSAGEALWKFDGKLEIANFAQMPGKITPIIKTDSDNELHNYYMPNNKGNVQVNDYKSHDDELHNYLPIRSNSGNVEINEYKSHDDADNELHNYYMPNNKGNIQVNDYKSHDDADNEFYNDISIRQPSTRFIARRISFNPQEKKNEFLAYE